MVVVVSVRPGEIAACAVDRWYVGVDLGQSTDPTAISVIKMIASFHLISGT